MTTNIREYIDFLKVFQLGLEYGLLDMKIIIDWADKIIHQDEIPDNFVIELSLSGHKSVDFVITIINDYIGPQTSVLPTRVIIGLLHQGLINGQIKLRNVTAILDGLIWKGHLTENEKTFLYGLDDELNLAESKIHGLEKGVEEATLRFTELYKEFRIDNPKEWNEINGTIDKKVEELYKNVITRIKNPSAFMSLQAPAKKMWWKIWKN